MLCNRDILKNSTLFAFVEFSLLIGHASDRYHLAYRIGGGCIFTVKVNATKYTLLKIIFDDACEKMRLTAQTITKSNVLVSLGLLLFKAFQQTKLCATFHLNMGYEMLTCMQLEIIAVMA